MNVVIHQNVILHGITLAENSTIDMANLQNLVEPSHEIKSKNTQEKSTIELDSDK